MRTVTEAGTVTPLIDRVAVAKKGKSLSSLELFSKKASSFRPSLISPSFKSLAFLDPGFNSSKFSFKCLFYFILFYFILMGGCFLIFWMHLLEFGPFDA